MFDEMGAVLPDVLPKSVIALSKPVSGSYVVSASLVCCERAFQSGDLPCRSNYEDLTKLHCEVEECFVIAFSIDLFCHSADPSLFGTEGGSKPQLTEE